MTDHEREKLRRLTGEPAHIGDALVPVMRRLGIDWPPKSGGRP